MKQKLLIVLLIVILGLALETLTSLGPPPQIIEAPVETHREITARPPAPDFTFTTLEKQNRTLAEFRGKTVILNFWATWCAPCLREFPTLLELAEKHADDTVLLAISVDENPAQIDPFLKRFDETARSRLKRPNVVIAIDPQRKVVQDLFGTTMFPETFIIGPDMTIRHKIVGEIEWESQELQTLISQPDTTKNKPE
ncbi:MAG: TlpA family protein disulfide reductase [Alphaproteobacteria bacterium]|nr:TlpA family protein disulfide reductase [Alphaproteobacteria bacterium]